MSFTKPPRRQEQAVAVCSVFFSTFSQFWISAFLLGQGLSVDVAGFDKKMADEKMKSNQARSSQKAAGGKAMVLEAEQVRDTERFAQCF